MENLELAKKLLQLKTTHKIKEVSLRALYEKKIREMEDAQRQANKSLGESREAIEQREIILRKQLMMTQSSLSKAEVQAAKLKQELENQYKNKVIP